MKWLQQVLMLSMTLLVPTLPVPVVAAGDASVNTLTPEEKEAGWTLLFNGTDLTGWKCSNGRPVQSRIEDGALVPHRSGGYLIIHEKTFGDFILKCDVRWEDPRCNSGIFFRVEDPANPVHTGFEIQVMSGKGHGRHDFGAIYDLAAPSKNAARPTGEWNEVMIHCAGPEIRVTVNGELVTSMNCDDFHQPGFCPDGSRHKFKLNGKPRAVKDFARSGFLGFQDHGHKVWYRNVKLLELKD